MIAEWNRFDAWLKERGWRARDAWLAREIPASVQPMTLHIRLLGEREDLIRHIREWREIAASETARGEKFKSSSYHQESAARWAERADQAEAELAEDLAWWAAQPAEMQFPFDEIRARREERRQQRNGTA
jgi:hypothetical protein